MDTAIEKHYSRMNPMQRQAVLHTDGPILILAGAGSGKTTVLINRIDNMVRFCGIKPWNILAITFTNKAAGELKIRLENQLGDVGGDVHSSTFHSLCVRVLRREIDVLGYTGSFTIYDSDDSQRVVRDGIRAAQLDEKMFAPRAVLSSISRAKDSMLSPMDMLEAGLNDYRQACVAKVYDYYQKQLAAANALDFDDIILLTVKLFQQHPEVLEKYQNRWKYIMVDEYQDTNHTQYNLVSLLAASHRNLCVVGDDDQSIYKFRGATIENILSFESQFPGAQVIRLEENYRSTQTILTAANEVIANNTTRKGKTLWTSAGDGEPVQIHRLRDENEEARAISDMILANVKAGGKFSDHAVLYRVNAQSNSVEKALAKNAIPYRIIGGLRFYERKEIKDMIAYLSVMENPADTLRLLRIINEPKRGVGESTITAMQEIAGGMGCTMFEVIAEADSYPALQKRAVTLTQFAAMIRELAEMAAHSSLAEVLDALLERSGYAKMLESQGFEGVGRLENIMELKSNLMRYTQEAEQPTLSGFLEEISLYTDLDNYDADADAVVLMTVHSAKGLEFPYVIIAGMEEGTFPGRAAMLSQDELEEERRLAYVAITRAKKRLNITCAERRMLYGQMVYGRFSRFVDEIPANLVQRYDQETPRPKSIPPYISTPRARDITSAASIGVGVSSVPVKTKASSGPLHEGDRVSHAVFGEGTVLSAKSMANDTLVEIDFASKGVKKIMANFAKLAKL